MALLAIRRRRRAVPKLRTARWTPAVIAVGSAALGALVEYFADPHAGRRRRHTARDRTVARLRRGGRRSVLSARRTQSHALGVVKRTFRPGRGRKAPLDDATLAHKVETELFRREEVPKGHISVNAEEGVVFLRGAVERQEEIERIDSLVQRIAGVRAVENLLHTPGTPAPASRPKLLRERAATDQSGGDAPPGSH
jgi:hypothetical protein